MKTRIESVDLVRGIVMVTMALDHTRDYLGMPRVNPTDLASASAALFLTRWITHICAPTFFLLTGLGAGLMHARRSTGEVSRYLVTRGLWLIVLEVVFLRSFAYQFNVDFRVTMLLVIWALGWSMIVMGGLVHAGRVVTAVFGIVLVVGHNAFDGVRGGVVWTILHGPGFVFNSDGYVVFAAYPLVPWLGVTALGYVLAGLYRDTVRADVRRRWLLRGGFALIAAFVVLRWINGYGDPSPWATDARPLFTVLSFLNTTKYPPSLLFLLMTLGPALVLLSLAERATRSWTAPIVTLGRVPLFYFIAHFVTIHLVAVLVALVHYGTAHWLFESPDLGNYPFTPPPGWGMSLPWVYACWLCVVVVAYPLCAWYARVKQARPGGWLSYL